MSKLSNSYLLSLIKKQQLKNTADEVLLNFFGGSHALCEANDFWKLATANVGMISRRDITELVGFAQLRKRIVALDNNGLTFDTSHENHAYFTISDTELLDKSFTSAREFYISRGIPEGREEIEGRIVTKTVKVNDVDSLRNECAEHLYTMFDAA